MANRDNLGLMGTPLSTMLENALEQVLSGDVDRLQYLASREIQNLLAGYGADNAGAPVSGIVGAAPTLTPAAGFAVDLSAGSGFFQDATGVGADDSAFQVLRWPAALAALDFSGPSGNDRIDLVVATPGQQSTDAQVRNILQNPVTRTVVPAVVDKTLNPLSTIAIVTGTPGVTPSPPAVPSGKVALFEVYVPSTAASSADLIVISRLFRLVMGAHARLTGVLAGAAIEWVIGTGNKKPYMAAEANCKILIDGELLDFTVPGTLLASVGDGNASNNPYTQANASATASRPFYLYAVGGRASPQGSFSTVVGNGAPIALVASLVAPNLRTGKPSAVITAPRGAPTTSACYVGMGFTYPTVIDPTGLDSQACVSDAGWVTGAVAAVEGQLGISAGAFTMGSRPPFATRARLAMFYKATAAGQSASIAPNIGGSGGAPFLVAEVQAANQEGFATGDMAFRSTAPQLWINESGTPAAGYPSLYVIGYPHHVPRLDGGMGDHGA